MNERISYIDNSEHKYSTFHSLQVGQIETSRANEWKEEMNKQNCFKD